MKRRIVKQCERCKQEFVCGLFGCWCSQVNVTNTQYSTIVAQYHDCLCPACLSQITGEPLIEADGSVVPPSASGIA